MRSIASCTQDRICSAGAVARALRAHSGDSMLSVMFVFFFLPFYDDWSLLDNVERKDRIVILSLVRNWSKYKGLSPIFFDREVSLGTGVYILLKL